MKAYRSSYCDVWSKHIPHCIPAEEIQWLLYVNVGRLSINTEIYTNLGHTLEGLKKKCLSKLFQSINSPLFSYMTYDEKVWVLMSSSWKPSVIWNYRSLVVSFFPLLFSVGHAM